MRRIKLGILQTNHDKSVEIGDAFPDDAHRFRDLFDLQDERFSYRIYMTIGGEVPQDLNEQDVYMITGSPLSVLDQHVFTDALLDFIRRCDAAEKPLLGACFGHQAIALALGGTVERSSRGYNVGVEDTWFHETKEWMVPPRDSLRLYVFHEDHVTRLPEGCTLLGSSENCKIASFAKSDHIITTQAHPEFTYDFMECLLRFTEGKMPASATKKAWDGLALDQDGSVFGAWATNFFKKALSHAR